MTFFKGSTEFFPIIPRTKDGESLLAQYPRVMASITLTIGGTITEDDTITVNLNLGLLSGGKISKTISVADDDTIHVVAQKVVKAFVDDAEFRNFAGVAYCLAGVVTFKWPGALGNECTLARTLSEDATLTGTISNSGYFSGGSGPVIPLESFSFLYYGALILFEAGQPYLAPGALLKQLVASRKAIY